MSKTAITAIIALFLLAMVPPLSAQGETISATTTLTVTIPPRPVSANVDPGCAFVVTSSTKKAYCTVTLNVADPTVLNNGWRVTLSVLEFTNTCGGSLPPNALTIDSAGTVVVINGQPVGQRGGPKVGANSVGQSLNSSKPTLVAKPGFGNGAYSVDLRLRLSVPSKTKPCTYVPTFVVGISYGYDNDFSDDDDHDNDDDDHHGHDEKDNDKRGKDT
jgi:hypothetical protein